MNIRNSYNEAFKTLTSSLSAAVVAALEAYPEITKVKAQEYHNPNTINIKITFEFLEARCTFLISRDDIRDGNGYTTSSQMILKGAHLTVDSAVKQLSKSYYDEFTKTLALKIMDEKIDDLTINRRQRLFMRQARLIEAGFEASLKTMPNGEYRIVITHPMSKSRIIAECVSK